MRRSPAPRPTALVSQRQARDLTRPAQRRPRPVPAPVSRNGASRDGISPATGDTASDESVTNEPERDEEVKSSNFITHIGITTKSRVDSGLDKGEIDGDFDGGEAAGDADCGEALRTAYTQSSDSLL